MDERLRRVEILEEENRHQIQIVAESVAGAVSNDTFEAFRAEVAAGFEDLRGLLGTSHLDLDRARDAPGGRSEELSLPPASPPPLGALGPTLRCHRLSLGADGR